METIIKIDIFKMKEDIKSKVELQKFYKLQRKSDKTIFKERKITQKEAQYKHMVNREDLRALYAAYGLARDKSFSQIENHYPEENHPLQKIQYRIDKIMESYKMLEDVQVQSEI